MGCIDRELTCSCENNNIKTRPTKPLKKRINVNYKFSKNRIIKSANSQLSLKDEDCPKNNYTYNIYIHVGAQKPLSLLKFEKQMNITLVDHQRDPLLPGATRSTMGIFFFLLSTDYTIMSFSVQIYYVILVKFRTRFEFQT